MRFLFRAVPAALTLGAFAVLASLATAQTPAAADAGQAPPSPTLTLRTGTQIVVVDVTVTDRNGTPFHNLKAEDFLLTEDKTPQTVRHFEEHSVNDHPVPGPPLNLPPGMFTDYTPVPPDSTLNVLLLDSLNTPTKDQMFLRSQLADFVKKAKPGTRLAIFGMSSRLFLLQGFTSDPAVLKNAVEHKLIPRSSALLADPTGSNVDTETLSDIVADTQDTVLLANVQQFEAETESYQTQLRMRYTLDAFNAMAHYLSGFPGRKNLIWFSGSFPFSVSPDPTLQNPFGVMGDVSEEFRETTNLFARAQVAVFPVDARGLMTAPMYDAANSGRKYAKSPTAMTADLQKFAQSQADEHGTMDQLAESTGGKAFYNTNGLADATAKAIEAGSNYYTLAYSPSDHNYNGAFRTIRVSLTDAAKARGLVLNYRQGYYADDPFNVKKTDKTASLTESAAAAPSGAANYARVAMQRGAPTPSDILMKVRVLPDAATPTDKLAPDNSVDPAHPMKPPYRTYDVDLIAIAGDIGFERTPDGHFSDTIDVKVMVYDVDGQLLDVSARAARINLTAQTYKQILASGLSYHAQVSAPAKGESFLRIGIHDLNANRFGVVEVPTAAVSGLKPPAPAPAQPPPGATASPSAQPGPAAGSH